MPPIPRLQAYEGPALLSYGFRPFFLFAAIYSGTAILAWLPTFYGELSIATAFAPRDWHIHEMLFGYAAAVITGFLLTAIPNWTGRLPIQGTPLAVLVAIWLAGRVAVTSSALIGWMAAAAIDCSFLALVAAAAAREILAGRNWRNLKVVAVVGVLAAVNLGFHLEAHFRGAADISIRGGIGTIVLLIILVGGRVVPSFTHNWLARQRRGRLPISFNRFDVATVVVSAIALIVWTTFPLTAVTAWLLLATGLLQAIRLGRWAGDRTLTEPLVAILHIGYGFIVIGFLAAAAGALDVIPASAGLHAFAAGAIGTMTLAVMTRASLGHTGRPLIASRGTQIIYLAVVIAALSRLAAVMLPQYSFVLLHIAAFSWVAAFLGFALAYGPLLVGSRRPAAARDIPLQR
jgi:uncharacterized protein involved in response to NO